MMGKRPVLFTLALSVSAVSGIWLFLGLWVSGPQGLSGLETAAWPAGPKRLSQADAKTPANTIFATSVGPNAVPEVKLDLKGVVRGPRGEAALLSIAGAPATWINLNATLSGVTLVEVGANKVLVDTPLGFRTIVLGGESTPEGRR